jgi:hypothetical protein
VLGEANCIKGFGNIALRGFDHDAATALFQQALELFSRIPDPYSMALARRSLAFAAPNHQTRREHLAEAKRLLTSIDRPDLVQRLAEEFPDDLDTAAG